MREGPWASLLQAPAPVKNLGHEALIEPPPPQTLPDFAARRGLFGGCIGHMSGHGLELDAEVPFRKRVAKALDFDDDDDDNDNGSFIDGVRTCYAFSRSL